MSKKQEIRRRFGELADAAYELKAGACTGNITPETWGTGEIGFETLRFVAEARLAPYGIEFRDDMSLEELLGHCIVTRHAQYENLESPQEQVVET